MHNLKGSLNSLRVQSTWNVLRPIQI